jgi:tetrahydromethanopterin S-methyltransferase subunit G
MSRPPTNIEKESLEAHVELCHQRYATLENRLTVIEKKVDEVGKEITNGNQTMVRVLIGSAGTIVAGLLSTIVVLLLK